MHLLELNFDVSSDFLKRMLKEKLNYHFNNIRELEFRPGKILIELSENENKEEITEECESILAKYNKIEPFGKRRTKKIEPDNLFSLNEVLLFEKAASELVHFLESNYLGKQANDPFDKSYAFSKGVNMYSGNTLMVFKAISLFIQKFFNKCFNTIEIDSPSLIPVETLERSGYFETGIHHLCFVPSTKKDRKSFQDFVSSVEQKKSKANLNEFLVEPNYVLNPAVCLPCYPLMENKVINENKIISIGIEGKVFRDEGNNTNNNERLKEFIVRDSVFFGSGKLIDIIHKKIISYCQLFIKLFGINCEIVPANDIFFGENEEKQVFSQLISYNKLEILYKGRKEFSIGSINKHNNHFSSKYNITLENSNFAETMCVGFGLSRIVYALLEEFEISDLIKNLKNNIRNIAKEVEVSD